MYRAVKLTVFAWLFRRRLDSGPLPSCLAARCPPRKSSPEITHPWFANIFSNTPGSPWMSSTMRSLVGSQSSQHRDMHAHTSLGVPNWNFFGSSRTSPAVIATWNLIDTSKREQLWYTEVNYFKSKKLMWFKWSYFFSKKVKTVFVFSNTPVYTGRLEVIFLIN